MLRGPGGRARLDDAFAVVAGRLLPPGGAGPGAGVPGRAAVRPGAPRPAGRWPSTRARQPRTGCSGPSAFWDADLVHDDLRDYVAGVLGDPDGVLIGDDTGFEKGGTRSAGVTAGSAPARRGKSRTARSGCSSPTPVARAGRWSTGSSTCRVRGRATRCGWPLRESPLRDRVRDQTGASAADDQAGSRSRDAVRLGRRRTRPTATTDLAAGLPRGRGNRLRPGSVP